MTAGESHPNVLDIGVDRPPFEEPWQGEAFALVVSLQRAGRFTAHEWAEALSREIASDRQSGTARPYYRQWLAALEILLATKGLVAETELKKRKGAWREAYLTTPHGQAITLDRDNEEVA